MASDIGPFSTAGEMLAALDDGSISSAELTELHIGRIEAYDQTLNSIPVRTFDRARAAAVAADSARARGERAPLLGLPMTLKESTLAAGLPQSAGLPVFSDHVPTVDGPIASAVFAAGAALLGKTNIPVALADWQADSPVYGRTVNPWDHSRTPGGSTGGGGAALAAGLTPLEIGSDIGGSIRVPAAYCGVYGHRPSETAVPKSGAFPLADLPSQGTIMGVQGPLARSASDLELLFDVVAGPDGFEDVAWRLDLPPARRDRLSDFRVAIMPPTPLVSPSSEMQQRIDELASVLATTGATVATAMPDVDHERTLRDYLALLMMMTAIGQPAEERAARAAALAGATDPLLLGMADGLRLDAYELQRLYARRAASKAAWAAFFRDWDVLVCPTALSAAFPHATGPQGDRTLRIDGQTVPYMLNIVYPMWAIYTGQPSTAFPAGLDAQGLPLGLQAIGPYLEDRTTLRFAQLLEREWHRFVPPPAYAD